MIIELPKEFKYEGKGEIRKYAEVKNGVLYIYGSVSFRKLMYNITYTLKGNNICYYCGKRVKARNITLDHIYPQNMGEPTITDNLIPCCRDCNCEKSNFSESEYKVFKKLPRNEYKIFHEFIEFKHEVMKENGEYQVPKDWIDYENSGEFITLVEMNKEFKGKKYSYTKRYFKEYHTIPKPIVVSKNRVLIDGYTCLMVAKEEGLKSIPTITLENVIVHL